MKHKTVLKQSVLVFSLSAGLMLSSVSLAADNNNPPGNSNTVAFTNWLLVKLSRYIDDTVKAAVQTRKNLMFQDTPNVNESVNANNAQTQSQAQVKAQANEAVLSSLKLLVTTSDNANIIKTAATQVPVTVSNANQYGASFNLNSLIDTTSLTKKQSLAAKRYIAFASGLVRPDEVLDPKEMLSDLDNLNDYKVQLGISLARTTAALSTLYQLLAERTPQAGLGKAANITVDKTTGDISFTGDLITPNDASPLMVAKFNAEKRADNPTWHANMEKATPATLQRETLYTMADLQKSLFNLQMVLERQTALLSMIAMQQNEAQQKPRLEEAKEAVYQAKALIDKSVQPRRPQP